MHYFLLFSFHNTSVSTNVWIFYATQFGHCLQLRVQSHKTASSPALQTPIASPGCHLRFWPTGYNLLEWVTELREMFYLLDYWFIVKGYKSGTAGWKRARVEGKGAEPTDLLQVWPLPAPPRVQQPGPLEPLVWFFFFLTEASLQRHDWLNHWTLLSN